MAERPNILIVITHDTGRHLGCYGRGVNSPNLDKLAQEGVLFTNAFCTAPQCSPSRASLLTGMMPHNHGLIGLAHRGFRLREDVPKLPQILAEAGYETHLFGFQHELPPGEEKKLGYKHFHKAKTDSCLDVTPLVLDFLEGGPKEPFFAMVAFVETHRPFPDYDGPIDNVKVPPFLPDAPEVRRDVAGLNLLVERVDDAVGRMLVSLSKAGLSDRTLFIFTTDHGTAFPGAKATLFDPGLEIALIMRGPADFSGGKKVDAMVSNMDIMPTILQWLGLPIPAEVQGKSLLPLLRGEAGRAHQALFFELTFHAAYDPIRAVRTEDFKYIRSFDGRPFWLPPNIDPGLTKEWFRRNRPEVYKEPRPSEMLFDLRSDPLERRNLAGEDLYARVLSEMRSALERWMEETEDPLLRGHIPPPKGSCVTPQDAWDPDEKVVEY